MTTQEATKQMTTKEVANRLVKLAREGKIDEAQAELFGANAVSVEANESMGPKITTGLRGIQEKSKLFQSMVQEFHGAKISEPLVTGSHFAITWALDATMKGKQRTNIEEVCVYKVEDGKIVLEQFFF